MYNYKYNFKEVIFNITLKKDALYFLYIKLNNLKFTSSKYIKTLNKILNLKYYFYFFYFIITNIVLNYKISVINNTSYLSNTYNRINNRFIDLPSTYLSYNNVYFFWYFFNQDPFIQIFINLTMKHGKKNTSYKNIYSSFFFLKKLIGFQPITIFKIFLTSYRFLFDMKTITFRERVMIKPKLLSYKSQLTKSLKYIFNGFNLSNLNLKKKNIPFFKKIGYLILNFLFNENQFNEMMEKDIFYIKQNVKLLRQMESFGRYITDSKHSEKKKMWKIKFKSVNKKMKFFRKNKSYFKVKIVDWIDFKKIFLLNRYNTNLQSRSKLKSKWYL